MAIDGPYVPILVESYYDPPRSGYRGGIRIRPIPGEAFSTGLNVECSKAMREKYPLGTVFRMRVKLTDREGRGEFLVAISRSEPEVITPGPAGRLASEVALPNQKRRK